MGECPSDGATIRVDIVGSSLLLLRNIAAYFVLQLKWWLCGYSTKWLTRQSKRRRCLEVAVSHRQYRQGEWRHRPDIRLNLLIYLSAPFVSVKIYIPEEPYLSFLWL